jgi:hypothetical protein
MKGVSFISWIEKLANCHVKILCHSTQINYQNTIAVTTLYILAVHHNDIFLQSFVSPFLPLQFCLAYAEADFTVCIILFNDFVFTNFIISTTFFHSRMDFIVLNWYLHYNGIHYSETFSCNVYSKLVGFTEICHFTEYLITSAFIIMTFSLSSLNLQSIYLYKLDKDHSGPSH